ncbi:MAG: hypothetical protein K9L78_02400, partial [Victivallales bacterium]|nr:hypothetical protein [Victivallales bacterium]
HTLLLFISMAVLYLVLHFNLNSSTYTQKQREKVYNKILTGRKTIKHDFSGLKQLYRKNWKEKLAALKKSGEVLTDRNKKELRQEIYFQTLTNSGQVEPGKSSEFIFKNIKEDSLTNIILKFRIFVGNIKMISKQNKPKAAGAWEIFDPRTKKYNKIKGSLQDYTSNIFYELKLPAGCLSKDGTAKLRYINKAESVSVFFQITESPVLYITEVPFLNNYLRAFIVIFLSLVLITGLGCALGGVFSFPIAVITVAAYLVIGSISNFVTLSSKSALDIKKEQSFEKSLTDFLLSVIIPLSRFDTSDELSSGILIEKSKIFDLLFFLILCKEFPLLFLCIYIYSKKELGLITKK